MICPACKNSFRKDLEPVSYATILQYDKCLFCMLAECEIDHFMDIWDIEQAMIEYLEGVKK